MSLRSEPRPQGRKVSLNYAKITVTFTPDTGPPVTFCFDRKQNKKC